MVLGEPFALVRNKSIGAADRTRNRLVDGLSASGHYAGAFSSPSRAFAGRASFHTAAARDPSGSMIGEHSEHEPAVLWTLTVFPFCRRMMPYKVDAVKNRLIVVDRCRNVAEFESREFSFEIISEKF